MSPEDKSSTGPLHQPAK